MITTKSIRTLALGLLVAVALAGCATDDRVTDLENELDELRDQVHRGDDIAPEATPVIRFGEEGRKVSLELFPGQQKTLRVEASGMEDITVLTTDDRVIATYDEEKSELRLAAPLVVSETPAKVLLTGNDAKGVVYRAVVTCRTRGYDDPLAMLVVNEGNVWGGEMGSMIYFSPLGDAVDHPFATINNTDFGICPQDMVPYRGKLYVISQGTYGKEDGGLTVLDGHTLRLIAKYKSELTGVNTPTHLAILDADHIYIRHEGGVSCFSESTKTTTFVQGSEGADKHPLLSLGGKVFFHAANVLYTIDESGKIVSDLEFPGMISGIAKADDSHLYLSYTTDEAGFIVLIRTSDSEIEKTNTLPLDQGGKELTKMWASTSTISAKGDTIYFGEGMTTSIYRHLFKSSETKEMWVYTDGNAEHKQTYQTPAVHPVTGKVYYCSMKDFGPVFRTNTIFELDLKGDKGKITRQWENMTHFPAGFFFPYAR